MGISKTGVLILVNFAAAIRLKVHGGRKAASVRKAVRCALRFSRRNFGGSKAGGYAHCLIPKHRQSHAALKTAKNGERKHSQQTHSPFLYEAIQIRPTSVTNPEGPKSPLHIHKFNHNKF